MEYRDEVYFEALPPREVPFSVVEFASRLDRIRAAMVDAGIDCLFLTSPESLYYVSGFRCMWYHTESPSQWPPSSGIAVHADHDRFIHFESEREAVLTRTFSVSRDVRYSPRDSYRDGGQFVARELAAEGWLHGTIGLELQAMCPNRVVSERFERDLAAAGAQRIVDGSAVLREVRWLKSEAEMACLHEAARIAEDGLRAAREAMRPGVTELEVQGEILRALTAAGGETPAMMVPVLSGPKSNAAHAVATRRRMRAGDIVTVDLAGVYDRYHVNAARTFSLGEPAAAVLDTGRRAAGVMDVVIEHLRPGLPVAELNQAVKRYYEEHDLWSSRGWIGGYEMGIAFLSDWVGHFVYDPLSERNADRVFEPGTAVNHESQIFLPGHVGQFFMIETLLFEDSRAVLATAGVAYAIDVVE